MDVCSPEWVLGLLLIAAFIHCLPSLRLRQGIFALCSTGFLLSQKLDPAGLLTLGLFLSTGYAVVRALLAYPRRWVLACYLSVLIVSFVWLKQYAFLRLFLPASIFQQALAVVGLSYMLFRQIHLVVDALQGQIERFTLWGYLNYQLNLFGLIAGPIQRFQDFVEQWDQLTPVLPDREAMLKSFLRIFVGVIKITALAPPCLTTYNSIFEGYLGSPPGWPAAGNFLLLTYLYPAYLYFNFSGYCDMVIGGASLVGLRMPENFNYPFLSRNLGELWTRWHRTLGFWIRDYLFTPLFKGSVEQFPRLSLPLSLGAYLLAFSLAGVWHGATSNFLVFGLLNGVGVSAAKLWEHLILKRSGRKGLRKYLQTGWIRVFAIICTINYFSFTLIFFAHGLDECRALFKLVFLTISGA